MAITVALAVWFTRAPAVPVVESVVQLTNDGRSKSGNLETDGARIYFNEGSSGSFRIAQVSVNGGQTGDVTTNLVNAQIAGLTGDGSGLLVLIGAPIPTRETMWSLPLPVGEARRLGDIDVSDASLFPDGHLLYAVDSAVFVAEKDGSNPHKLEELSKYGSARNLSPDGIPVVSPDGKRLVGSAFDNTARFGTIYEAASDGTGVYLILNGKQGLPTDICCPRWTADGKYLLFRGQSEGRWDLWALSTEKRILGGSPAAVRLTNGPVSYSSFAASRDGKQIFAIGAQRRGELVRYDPKVSEFVPYLGGISAYDPTFSRDGKWVAYLSYPEHTLWRSRADGSDRLQLTYPPQVVIFPRISPDGSKVAFSTYDGPVYVVSMNGGAAQKLTDHGTAPDWSPDGSLLAISSAPGGESYEGRHFQPKIVDLRNGAVSVIPDSQGMLGPWFASQDTLIATSDDQSKFVLYDFKTRKRTDLIASPDRFVNWEVSPDGKYFFYQTGGNDPKILRMKLADRAVE